MTTRPAGGVEGELPPGGPFVVIGYDPDGEEVGRASLDEITAEATPKAPPG